MNRYPTDEELNSLIERLEQEELYAPKHLKEEILIKARRQEQAKAAENKRAQPVSFLMYTFKMAVGMAAAVFLVFMIPFSNGSNISRAEMPEKEWDIFDGTDLKDKTEQLSLDEKISSHISRKVEDAEAAISRLFSKNDMESDKNVLEGDYDEN